MRNNKPDCKRITELSPEKTRKLIDLFRKDLDSTPTGYIVSRARLPRQSRNPQRKK